MTKKKEKSEEEKLPQYKKKTIIQTVDKREKFRMPFISSIDIEEEGNILKELEEERTLVKKEQVRLAKKWESKKFPTFRLTGMYLMKNSYKRVINKNDITKDLKFPKTSLDAYLSELNRFDGFPLRFIPKPKMKGYIELCTENKNDFDKWNGGYSKGLTSRTKRLLDTRKHVEINEKIKETNRAKLLSKRKQKIELRNHKKTK